MATTKLLGILPVWRGEYKEGTTYYKMNIVRQYGSEFIYTGGDNTTTAPATKGDTAITPNTGWEFFSEKGEKGDKGDAGEKFCLDDHIMELAPLMMGSADGWLVKLKAGTSVTSNGWNIKAKDDEDTWVRQDGAMTMGVNNTGAANILEVAYVGNSAANIDRLFANCTSLTSIDASGMVTSSTTSSVWLFMECNNLTALDIGGWDTSNTTGLNGMFYRCYKLAAIDVSGWDTSKVVNMSYMFQSCSSLTSLDVSGWDTSNVTQMTSMFQLCTSLTSIDVSGWDTSKVVKMSYMFLSCSSLASLDVANWDTSNVTNMTGMFNSCAKLRHITLGAGFFNTTQAIPFDGAANLGLNEDGTDNGWLAHLVETAPTITDGNARTISLPSKLKALSTSADCIAQLQDKGYTIA